MIINKLNTVLVDYMEDYTLVSYKNLVDKISTSKQKIKQKEYLSNGNIPIVDQGQSKIGGYTNDQSKILDCELPVMVFGDHTKIVKIINFQFAPGADGTKVLQTKEMILPELLAFFTEVLVHKVKDKGYARHYQHIEKINFPLPPLPIQKAIVSKLESLLTNLDQGIASLEKADAQLKIYRQAVLKKAFAGELTQAWRAQQTDLPTAAELLTQIKVERQRHHDQQLKDWQQAVVEWVEKGKEGRKPSKPKKLKELPPMSNEELEELGELPKGWKWIKLGNYCLKIQIGPFGTQLHKHEYVEDGVPIINPKHIKNQKIIPAIFISDEKAQSLSQYFLEENDIILGRRGEMGRAAYISKKEDKWFCGTGSLYIRFSKNISGKLYCLILSGRRIVKYLNEEGGGTTMTNLNSKILNNLPIQIIPLKEQTKIVQEIESRLSVCDNLAETISTSLQKSKALRQSILKKAFEGRLLTETELAACRAAPDYEPAAVLLERIKKEKAEREAAAKAAKKNKKKKGQLSLKV